MFMSIKPDPSGESSLPATGNPALPVKIHKTCRASLSTSDCLWSPRRTVTALPGAVGLLSVWRCISLLSHRLFCFLKMHWSHKILKTSATTRLRHCSSRRSRYISSWQQQKVMWEGAEPEVSVCVNWLTGASCWATQHPPFHLAYNHPKVTVVKVPQVQHRWTDDPRVKKCW